MGCYIGAHLARAGNELHFLARSNFAALQEHGLSIQRRHAEDFVLTEVHVHQEADSIPLCDLVIITLKATANDLLKTLLPPILGEDSVILTLQNGLGNVEFLQAQFPQQRILCALCFMALVREDPWRVRNFIKTGGYMTLGEGEGPLTEVSRQVGAVFCNAEIDCRLTDHLQEALWKKLVWNIPFNGLTIAAGGITTDQVLQSTPLAEVGLELMREIQQAAAALGYAIDDAFIERQYPFTLPMGPYSPSSVTDFKAGRPVEVEAIFGEPLRRGAAAGVAMPHLRTLYAILKRLAG